MKHTLNVLTLTALAAAASAQTAPASGLNYNNVTVSRTSRDNSLAVQLVLGQSNFVAGFATSNGDNTDYNYGQIAVGYVFKNVVQGIDFNVGAIQTNGNDTVYSVQARRELNEVYQGLEISVGYATVASSSTYADFTFGGYAIDDSESSNYIGLTYNINKTFAVGVSLNKATGYQGGTNNYERTTVYSVRASF